ncbi:hypothetical protein IP86_07055 [Rhodopseudomonas sp. AAP120]|nr:hypothetical protein IP86_07055 [Rhodopseudomonas sp. AAP120]
MFADFEQELVKAKLTVRIYKLLSGRGFIRLRRQSCSARHRLSVVVEVLFSSTENLHQEFIANTRL